LFHAVLTSGACERRSSERLLPGARGLLASADGQAERLRLARAPDSVRRLASPALLRFMAFAPG